MKNTDSTQTKRRNHTLTCGRCGRADGRRMDRVMHRDGTWHIEHIDPCDLGLSSLLEGLSQADMIDLYGEDMAEALGRFVASR